MAYDYSEDLALAKELIAEYGRSVTVQHLSAGSATSDTPWKGAGTPTVDKSHRTMGAFLPLSGSNDLGKLVRDKELLKRCEQVVLIPGTGKSSTDLGDFVRILDNATLWKIEWVKELKPGDTSLLYVMGVKR
jgi:hypothetical protein